MGNFLAKFIIVYCIIVFIFWTCYEIYTTLIPHDTNHTVYVSKNCILNEVQAGADYVFDCPR